MNHAETIAAIPPAGWALLFAALVLVGAVLIGLYQILLKKEVRLKHVELLTRKEAKEAQAEARSLEAEKIRYSTGDLISAQFSLSSNLLRRVSTGIYEAGLSRLPLEDEKDRHILRGMSRAIRANVEREVLFDIVRNHIPCKNDDELRAYSDAKAEGYWHFVKAELYRLSDQMSGVDVAGVMEHIPLDDYKELFYGVYSGVRDTALSRDNL